jgi:hypothetical protein
MLGRLVVAGVFVIASCGLLAGCAGGPDTVGERSTPRVDRGAETAACMREKGYEMADPEQGWFSVGAPEGVDREQWAQDLADCAGSDDAGSASGATEASPGDQEKRREVASCIRDHGYEDYPDDLAIGEPWTPPGDQDAFDEVSEQCATQAWGAAGPQGATGR